MLGTSARLGVLAAIVGLGSASSHAALVITEAMSSGGTADWFELTNTGPGIETVTGYKMDDSSFNFANSVLLSGVSTLASGESAVFVETDAPSTALASFRTFWGGSALTVQLGSYPSSGLGVGLSSGGDGVVVFDSLGAVAATSVSFGAATTNVSFNRPGNGVSGTFGSLSANGVGGGFTSTTGANVGSPGVVSPEPATIAAMSLVGLLVRRRRA